MFDWWPEIMTDTHVLARTPAPGPAISHATPALHATPASPVPTSRRRGRLASDRGQATVGYLGITAAVTVVVIGVGAAAVSFVPGVGQLLGCQAARAVDLVSGSAVRVCEVPSSSTDGATTGGFTATVVSDPVDSGTDELTIEVDAPPGTTWSVSSDTPWAAIPPPDSSGTDSDVVRVTVHANPGEARDGTITLTADDGTTITIPFTQPGGQQNYVALGDSYSAGPGVLFEGKILGIEGFAWGSDGGFDESERRQRDWWLDAWNEDDCFRGKTAWPRLLGNGYESSSGTPNLSMGTADFAACSGATVDGSGGSPSVLTQIEDNADRLANADIVTVTVGGNDIDFAPIVQSCVIGSAADCETALSDGNDAINNGLADKLKQTYQAALDASPNATIYVIGYPPVVEADDDAGGLLKIDQGNVGDAARLILNLNQTTNQAVTDFIAENPQYGSRLVYVDPSRFDSPFNGHSVYDDDPYINGINLTTTGIAPGGDWVDLVPVYHPNGDGNQAYADYIAQFLLGYK